MSTSKKKSSPTEDLIVTAQKAGFHFRKDKKTRNCFRKLKRLLEKP
ncbi:MAG: hypothetical protein AAB699_02950 [Patescibacteria group bacterium]